MRKIPIPWAATGRLTNNFIYNAQVFECGPLDSMVRLDDYLNAMAREGWRLHTMERLAPESYFCVWEKLDYGEEKT